MSGIVAVGETKSVVGVNVETKEPEIQKLLSLSLTADGRVMDGFLASAYLKQVCAEISKIGALAR